MHFITNLFRYKGKNYNFGFIIHERIFPDDFALEYPGQKPPERNSFEIQVSGLRNDLNIHKPQTIGLTEPSAAGDLFINCFPSTSYEETKETMVTWCKRAVRFLAEGTGFDNDAAVSDMVFEGETTMEFGESGKRN